MRAFKLLQVSLLSLFTLPLLLFATEEPATSPVPKVSICIPVYDSEPYLPTALDSALAQTLNEVEIVCVDDGSTDGSLAILKSYAEKYPEKITVLENGTNRGTCYSRMRAILASRGEYILWLDSDDVLFPRTAEYSYGAAVENGADVIQFSRRTSRYNKKREQPSDLKMAESPGKPRCRSCPQKPIHMLAYGKISLYVWDKLWKGESLREMAERILPFAAENRIIKSEDNFFCWNALRNASKCLLMNYVGIEHRTNTGLAAKKGGSLNFKRQYLEGATIYSKFFLNNEKDPQIQKMYAGWHITNSFILNVLLEFPFEEGAEKFATYLTAYPEELRPIVCEVVKKRKSAWYNRVVAAGYLQPSP